jgi:tRNA A-37 threonylcarbamoyl transferase component Bud32
MSDTGICPSCGNLLPVHAPEGLCPACMLRAGAATEAADAPLTTGGGPGFEPPEPEQLAARFPQYEIQALIGQGGMGAVYRAVHRKLDRPVALKILPPEIGRDPAFAERFVREARALARLNHPSIVTVHDFGESEGLFYFVMEFVEGRNLRELLAQGQVEPALALRIIGQICDALSYAHEAGLVHRDIKPENVLLDREDRARIADFGLAKLLEGSAVETSLTATHQVMGTPHYMAPEQIETPAKVDQRADIYSLGVVFYEMLTGHLPLGRFEPPSQGAEVGEQVDKVVLKSLEREPEKRYQQAAEVKGDMAGIGVAAPAKPPTVSRTHRTPRSAPEAGGSRWRGPKDQPLLYLGIGGLVVFVLGFMPWFGFRIGDLTRIAGGSAFRDFGMATGNAWESNISPFGISIPTAIVPLIGILVAIGAVVTHRDIYRVTWKVLFWLVVAAEALALVGLILILRSGVPQIGLVLSILALAAMGFAAFSLRPTPRPRAQPRAKPDPKRSRERRLKGRQLREERSRRVPKRE